MEDDTYLRCTDCGWALPALHTPADERCPECNGALDVVRDSESCPRCGQTGGAIVCPRCRELEREPQGEAVRLFAPAPTQLAGQLDLNAGTSTDKPCSCGWPADSSNPCRVHRAWLAHLAS